MRVSSFLPQPVTQQLQKFQTPVKQVQADQVFSLDSVAFRGAGTKGAKIAAKPAALTPAVAAQPVQRLRSQTIASARIVPLSPDTNLAAAPVNEPSVLARLFGWSASTPKEPAPLQKSITIEPPKSNEAPRSESDLGQDSLAALSKALRAKGIEPAGLGFQYSEQEVYYPGGSYTNKLITANLNGQAEGFGAALVLKNPELAASEVIRFLSRTA